MNINRKSNSLDPDQAQLFVRPDITTCEMFQGNRNSWILWDLPLSFANSLDHDRILIQTVWHSHKFLKKMIKKRLDKQRKTWEISQHAKIY